MEYIGNRPPGNTGGYDPYDTGGYWWNYNNPYGAYDPYGYNTPVTSWEDQIRQSGGTAPTTPNEGQTTETPEGTDPGSFAPGTGNPTFTTEVIGNPPPPLDYTGSQIDPYLAEYLSSLPQVGGTGTGGGGGNAYTYFTDPSGSGGGGGTETGGGERGNTNTYFTDPPAEERGNTYTYFSDPSFGDPTRGNTYTYFTDPSAKDYHTYFAPVPTTPPSTKPPKTQTGEEGGGGGGQQGQQKQQPGVGKLLAALPMLAAFQGGTTTTPAPYAHLGPHTPVAPVFKPQGRGNPIPSIGQLLAGVK